MDQLHTYPDAYFVRTSSFIYIGPHADPKPEECMTVLAFFSKKGDVIRIFNNFVCEKYILQLL